MDISKIAQDIVQSHNEEYLNRYVKSLARAPLETQIYVCQKIFKEFDIALEKEGTEKNFLSTLLTIPIELAKFHQTHSSLLSNGAKHQLIESISSHFLARSNGANESLRLAILLFFSQVKNQEKWKLKRILERFGENLLHSIFDIYSTDKERASLALSFLTEHMEIFFSTSADLAGMTNTFLQNYMFKQHASFVVFMTEYKNYLLSKNQHAGFFTIHTAFLMRQALDLDHETLSFNLLKILIQYINEFDEEMQNRDFSVITKVMLHSKTLKGREIGLYIQKEFQAKHKISLKQLAKQFEMSFSSAIPTPSNKKSKRMSEGYTLFKKLLLLRRD